MLLKDVIGETYHPKNKDEQDFWAKHKVELFQNKYSTAEYDPLFQGSTIKISPREADRHGYSGAPSPKNPMDKSPEGNDEKHYEEVETEGDVIDEISVDKINYYMSKSNANSNESEKRKKGRALALKKKWGDKKYGLPEPKVKANWKEDEPNPKDGGYD